MSVDLAKELTLWVLGVLVSLCFIAWHPLVGDATWTSAIQRGEMLLLAVTLCGSAVGYAAFASASGTRDMWKAIVIALGLVATVICGLLYASFSQGVAHSEYSVAWKSYVAFGTSAIVGTAAVILARWET
jgi:cytochrome bd-type quinol oxidase subunit 2